MIDQFKNAGVVRFFPKGSFLFRQGDKVGNLFFIQTGLVKAYYETIDGKEFIKSFVGEGEFIASMQAVVADSTCSFSVLSLEASQVLEVPQQALLDLVSCDAEVAWSVNKMLLALSMKKERREYELLCMSPEARYLAFYEREFELIERLSQNDIARYLGITPVALSRIRKRLGLQRT
ncbi:MAG TPA: Crp/Fnr family transcriptional regulator [Cellvibrio sp.]|nr:Crp/Fnr family transcriptional regulator [Cellvibrio sp.]